MFPSLAPILLPVGLGAAVGFVRDNDQKNARTPLTKQYGTWVEGGALALGLISQMGGSGLLSGGIADALTKHGAAFLSERLVRSQLSAGGFGSPAPMSISGARTMSGMAPYRGVAGFQAKEPSMGLI